MNEWWLLTSLGLLLIIALIFALYPLRKYKLSLMLFTPIIFILLTFAYLNFGSWFQYQKISAEVSDEAYNRFIDAASAISNDLISKGFEAKDIYKYLNNITLNEA